ncbi:MFS transporter [Pantoea dispersa]|uniref:MFS transporter n=1 Tax=Pantoea dispersa TaxID=59814 RepID=UPI0021CA3BFE|nr:MFS transporter [Pantoea dispersa]
MKASLRLTLSGFVLIAVTYGLARFAWGMMMPQVAQQISFSPRASGMLAACSYLAYCLATPGATLLLARWGVRNTAMLAALTAMLGLLLLAAASSAWLIAGGLFIAGLGAGLASPALASAVSRQIDASRQTAANTLINAGTGAGYVTLSGILLVAGAAATPQNAASGVAAAFLTLAIGQICGAILFAQIYSSSAVTALLLFAAIPVALLVLVPANPPQRADA